MKLFKKASRATTTTKPVNNGDKEPANSNKLLRSHPSQEFVLPGCLLVGEQIITVDSEVTDSDQSFDYGGWTSDASSETTDSSTSSDDNSASDHLSLFEQLVAEEAASVLTSDDGPIPSVVSEDEDCIIEGFLFRKTTICFGHIDVIELGMTMGQHPACLNGPAVCLSSELVNRTRLQVEEYELLKDRSIRRTRRQLYISTMDRQRIIRNGMYDLGCQSSISGEDRCTFSPTRKGKTHVLVATNQDNLSPTTSSILEATPMYQRRALKKPTRSHTDPTLNRSACMCSISIPGPPPLVKCNSSYDTTHGEEFAPETNFTASLSKKSMARDIDDPTFDSHPQRRRVAKKRQAHAKRSDSIRKITAGGGVEDLLNRVRERDQRIDDLLERITILDEKTNQQRRSRQLRRRASTSSLCSITAS